MTLGFAPQWNLGNNMLMLWMCEENGTHYATGYAPDGTAYTAIGNTPAELRERIRHSCTVEGWPGWVSYGGGLNGQPQP